jgi:hypothetical protein
MQTNQLVNTGLLACGLMALAGTAFCAQYGAQIPAGSKIYVDPADGFDKSLSAALQKKKVPVTVVSRKELADYELQGVSDYPKPVWAKTSFLGQVQPDDRARVRFVSLKTNEVVFAYTVNNKNTQQKRRTAAEACAEHLKRAIDVEPRR